MVSSDVISREAVTFILGWVQVIEEAEAPKRLYMVLELVDGGMIMSSMTSAIKGESPTFVATRGTTGAYTEEEASQLFRQVLSGMAYLHGNNIVHR